MSFKHWPMVAKIASLLLLLGVCSLAGSLIAADRIGAIDARYTDLVENASKAVLKVARSGRAMNLYQAGIYAEIAADSVAARREAAAIRDEAQSAFRTNLEEAGRLLPSRSAAFTGLLTTMQDARERGCAETVRLAGGGTAEARTAALKSMSESCGPALKVLLQQALSVTGDLDRFMDQESNGASAMASATSRGLLFGMIAATLIVLGIAVWVVRSAICGPLRGAVSVMQALGRGDLAVAIAGTDRRDEVGTIAKTLEDLRGQLRTAEDARHAEEMRKEEERLSLARREKLAEAFVDRMQGLSNGFAQSSGEVADAAKNLSATAEETARQAQAVAAAAEEAASNVQTVAASSEEMAASIREITTQVSHSVKVADSAVREASASNDRIADLAAVAATIGDVIDLIKGIADQTNLLALNATIDRKSVV